jgi:hypothetical protein
MLDLEGARMFVQGGLMMVLSLVLLLVFAGWQMLRTDWVMGMIGLAFVPIAAGTLGRMGFLLRVTWLKFQELMAVLTLTMEDDPELYPRNGGRRCYPTLWATKGIRVGVKTRARVRVGVGVGVRVRLKVRVTDKVTGKVRVRITVGVWVRVRVRVSVRVRVRVRVRVKAMVRVRD